MSVPLSGAHALSPLHEYWAARPAAVAWRGRGRTLLPDEVSGWLSESAAFGAAAAFADISNRTLWSIEGAETIDVLSALTGDDPAVFQIGRSVAVVWCDASGSARGSGCVAIESAGKAILATEVQDAAWILACAKHFDVRAEATPAAGVRLAGPLAMDVLSAGGVKPTGNCRVEAPGIGPVLAMTQKKGAIDLWCAPDEAVALAWVLERAGACPAGATALNAWRVANGYLAAGVDWMPVHMAADATLIRDRAGLTEGGYIVAAWDSGPPASLPTAVYWPATAQHLALLWAPQQNGRQPAPPGNGHILGPATTD